jgi:hypothetical protein
VFSVQRSTTATPSQVWDVLADGWSFAGWVVGASRIRAVDLGWPSAGTRIHHSVGAWPLVVDDTTEVVRAVAGRELELQARGWPVGEARVAVRIEPAVQGCRITMDEDATHGPGRFAPRPLRWLAIAPRNTECLRRLVLLAEGRAR